MLKIRIIKTPPGFAPQKIRAQWLGTTIPLVPDEEAIRAAAQMDPNSPSVGGYIVSGPDAVQALIDAGKDEAAAFWANPIPAPHLRFARDCCEIVG